MKKQTSKPYGSLLTRWGLSKVTAERLFVLAVCATAVVLWPLLHKLGTRVCCFADLDGVCEALTAVLPGGALHGAAAFLSVLWTLPWLGGANFLLLGIGVTVLAHRWARLYSLMA